MDVHRRGQEAQNGARPGGSIPVVADFLHFDEAQDMPPDPD